MARTVREKDNEMSRKRRTKARIDLDYGDTLSDILPKEVPLSEVSYEIGIYGPDAPGCLVYSRLETDDEFVARLRAEQATEADAKRRYDKKLTAARALIAKHNKGQR